MSKGDETRKAILEHAVSLSSRIGLGQLSIGKLADELEMSKSGLFAHFKSKQNLQLQVLDRAEAEFIDDVVRPALRASAGEPRIRELFTRWVDWIRTNHYAGGCPFAQFSFELDDQPGELRDSLLKQQRGWAGFLAEAARRAVAEGHLREDLDVEQFAFEFDTLMLGFHKSARLLRDPHSAERVKTSFENFLNSAKE